jgi:thiol-disulfide isomerase/thioredoxin
MSGAKRTARRRKSSVAGKIMPPLDVRSKKHLSELKKRIEKGPITFILVWATWCPHCHTMMPHFDAASKTPNRSVQSVKIEESMLSDVNEYLNKNINKSAKPINVEGFPSIIVVDKQGNTITDVEPIRNTETMSKVMTEAGPLAEEAGVNSNVTTNTSIKASIKNIANNKNSNRGLLENIGVEESGMATGEKQNINSNKMNMMNVKNTPKNINIGEDELKGSIASNNVGNKNIKLKSIANNKLNNAGKNNKNNKKESLKEAEAPSPINTFSAPKNKINAPSPGTNFKKEAEEVTSLAAPMTPPNVTNDIEQSNYSDLKVGGGKGGSLYSAMARTTYTLAPAAALLATAALVIKDKKLSTRKHSKKHRKTQRHRS